MAPLPVYSHKFANVSGTANTQLKFSFPTLDMQDVNLLFSAAGGNFASQSVLIQVAIDGSDWRTVDTLNVGNAATYSRYYNVNLLASGAALNPVSFPAIRITVPAIGLGRTASVLISGKVSQSYHDESTGLLPIDTNYL